ncbi:MAG: rhodanese-like domain-containing protein [Bdellovibrionota bacterium]
MPKRHFITAFYQFTPLNNIEQIKALWTEKAEELGIKGLVILGKEGFNSTSSAENQEALEIYKQFLLRLFKLEKINFKDSASEKAPFRRFVVKVREEIVTLGTPELVPNGESHRHLTPEQWNEVLEKENDYVLIDTRNWYEYKIGTFKGAINPNTEKFGDFPAFLEKEKIPKDKKMLIFCTGGIRCERGILELERQGYNNVYQLEGGILKYLEEKPDQNFEGECFVFDHRVAVDQKLQPTKQFGLCPHCGQPSAVTVCCKRCDHETLVCEDCMKLEFKQDTCSKHCAYQWRINPGRKGPHQAGPEY